MEDNVWLGIPLESIACADIDHQRRQICSHCTSQSKDRKCELIVFILLNEIQGI